MPVVTAGAVTTQLPKQLSDQGSLGTCLGVSAADLVGFFRNDNGVAQPSGNALRVAPRGAQGGTVTTYSTTQSPAIVNADTSGERAATVQTGTGFTMQLATTDLIFVNKPTSQAGLGVGNIRVSAANICQIGFHNASAGNITPTATEVYKIVAIRGIPTIAATLSPVSVAADTTVEQQFTITPTTALPQGLQFGQLVQVSKPTSQAGLDIVGCRIVSSGQGTAVLGITFINVTAAPIVPTAAEVYTIWSSSGLDCINNLLHYGFNVGTVGAIGPGVVITGGSTALLGALATDRCIGILKPTLQAAATNAAIPAPSNTQFTADVVTLGFFGVGTGYTPTASEVYGITAERLNPAGPLALYSQTLTPTSVAAITTAEQTFTVTGLVAGSSVWVNKPSWQPGLGIAGVRVSAVNTLAINFVNTTATAIVPTSEAYIIGNFQQVAPGAGNSVAQDVTQSLDQTTTLANAMKAALGPTTGVNLLAAN